MGSWQFTEVWLVKKVLVSDADLFGSPGSSYTIPTWQSRNWENVGFQKHKPRCYLIQLQCTKQELDDHA